MGRRQAFLLGRALGLLLAFAATAAAAETGLGDVSLDASDPAHDAVVGVGGCTGTLIADRVVLAAAHCFAARNRATAPEGTETDDCLGLAQQAGTQGGSWEDPMVWYPSRHPKTILFGNDRQNIRLTRQAVAYSLPRCTDMVLLRLDLAPPPDVARPLQVLMDPPADPDRAFSLAPLRHAGWGRMQDGRSPDHLRKTGRVDYWAHNLCNLFALPPLRDGRRRILTGDSGSPLLWRLPDREIVIGVLWGRGEADVPTCGRSVPPPPRHHGAYNPTFRTAIAGAEATDIGQWLRTMVPEAEYRGDGS